MSEEMQIIKAPGIDLPPLVVREKIQAIETAMRACPDVLIGDCCPLKHSFAKGLYVREITVPAGMLTVTKIHKFSHPAFLLEGEMSIMEEWGPRRVSAPAYFITRAGTKRVIYHHTKVVLVTVHATEEQDTEKIEEEIIAKSFDEMDDVVEIENFVQEVTKCLG